MRSNHRGEMRLVRHVEPPTRPPIAADVIGTLVVLAIVWAFLAAYH
jgi:hypothetical protein